MRLRNEYFCMLLFCLLLVVGCAGKRDYLKPFEDSKLSDMVSEIPAKKFNDRFVFDGVIAIEKGNWREANKNFNRALKFDPQSSHLHFLNALTYQLRGAMDDVTHFQSAEAGYMISLQLDPRNFMAAYQLGQLKFREHQYREAQNAFAYGLLLQPDNLEMLQALSVASYYSQDLNTAYSATRQIMQLRNNHPNDLRTATVIYAALGEFDSAENYLDQYKKNQEVNSIPIHRLSDRVADWRRFHKNESLLRLAQADAGDSDASAGADDFSDDSSDDSAGADDFSDDSSDDSAGADDSSDDSSDDSAGADDSSDDSSDDSGGGDDSSDDSSEDSDDSSGSGPVTPSATITTAPGGLTDSTDPISAAAGATDVSSLATSSGNQKNASNRMVLVDVAIIRSEERLTTDKGVNLLNGLQLVLAGDLFDFQSAHTSVGGADTNTNAVDSEKSNVNFKVSLPTGGISYNLNIFNDNNDLNEVLARPTIVALDGEMSDFFSGAIFHVVLNGVSGSEGAVTDVPVGINLAVTPNFIDDNTLKIKVDAARAFLEAPSSNAKFGTFSQTTKTHVTANVVMKFGETLVLSGLSEKEDEFLKDGVPFLQDLPGFQYFFSHQDTLKFNKSVLILITPHKPRYTYQDGTEKKAPKKKVDLVNLKKLKSRPDWFKPASNLDAAFEHLKDNRKFTEFQSGDVKMESWDDPLKLESKIQRTLEFLYY